MDSIHNDDPNGNPYADLELGAGIALAEHSPEGSRHLVLMVGRTAVRHEPIIALQGILGMVITTTGTE
ncbi:hypothetical protein [Leucobacter sp. M11]|uniref:hypothetical protein n=1 Tax=Leucobacter sp. M11 TaxID=2993565 RepID=UPI002D7F9B56|nr:hypothetical protein [Leucobacter sp. M11]MEB4613758.1 hypothetical protein [Leucobacter sp. M11]